MKSLILTIAIVMLSFTLTKADEPTKMYIHLTKQGGDSILEIALSDIDSIVYYETITTVDTMEDGYINPSAVTDIDGNVYSSVRIGTQTWTVENLRVTKYPNGTPIPEVKDSIEWSELGDNNYDDAYCSYNNLTDSIQTFGYLYTHAAAIGDNWTNDNQTNQGIAPDGWHIPSMDDWNILLNYLNTLNVSSLTNVLRAKKYWENSFIIDNDSTNILKFSMIPTGIRSYYGEFNSKENLMTVFGCGTEKDIDNSYVLYIMQNSIFVTNGPKSSGISIRCIKN